MRYRLTAEEMNILRRRAQARQARNNQARSVDRMVARGDSYDPTGLHLMGLMGEYALLVRLFGLPYAEDYFVRDQWANTHDFTINGIRGEIRTRTHAGYSFYNLTPQMNSDVGVAAYLVDGTTATGRVAFAGWLTQGAFEEHSYVARDRHPGWKGNGYLISNRHLQPIGSLWEHLHTEPLGC